jgi:hypothetical protein
MKKEWKQPELTVLLRTRPEEAILITCKSTTKPSVSSSSSSYDGCRQKVSHGSGWGQYYACDGTICSSVLNS